MYRMEALYKGHRALKDCDKICIRLGSFELITMSNVASEPQYIALDKKHYDIETSSLK